MVNTGKEGKGVREMASKTRMGTIDWVAWVLVVLGALNWGLIAVADLNLLTAILGATGGFADVVYILIGLGGLYQIWYVIDKK